MEFTLNFNLVVDNLINASAIIEKICDEVISI